MKSIRFYALFASLVLTAFLFTACSSARESFVSPADEMRDTAGVAAVPAAEESVQLETAAAEAAVGVVQPADADRKIVSTVDISLVVDDTNAVLAAIETMVEAAGGYIARTNLYQSGQDPDQLEGSLTLRVPADQLSDALKHLSSLAVKVESQNMDREDVTAQYVDLQARLENLEAAEKELRALLAEVRERPDANTEDILAVYRSLTDIRSQIEQLQGRINLLNDTVALSTINVYLRLNAATLPIVEEGWQPGTTLTAALRALAETLQRLGDLAIWWGVYLLPVVLILVIPFIIGFFVIRWFVRRRQRS
jgi:hypothetical protein